MGGFSGCLLAVFFCIAKPRQGGNLVGVSVFNPLCAKGQNLMKDYTLIIKFFKELFMKYGFYQVAFTLIFCLMLLIGLWKAADILNALAVFVK